MEVQKLFVLIVFGLLTITISGCASRTSFTTIEPDSVQELKAGQRVTIYTKNNLIINDQEALVLTMVVTDVNAERVRGELLELYAYEDRDSSGKIVEVKIEDIYSISVMKKELASSSSSGNHSGFNLFMTCCSGFVLILFMM